MTQLPPNFVGDFLKENGSNLVNMKNDNPELYGVVTNLLTYLDKNYGDGKSVVEEAVENVEEVKQEIKEVENQPNTLIKPFNIEIVWAEGGADVSGNYNTWYALTNALKEVHEDWKESGGGGYNKVKIKVEFEDGMKLLERIDVGESAMGDFDPNVQNIGDYLVQGGYINEALLKKYAFSDFEVNPQVMAEAVEKTKEEIEAEVLALEENLKFVDDEQEKQELIQEIEALKISLNFL